MTSTAPATEMSFVPPDLIRIHLGCLSANVYPKIKPGMPNFECTHAFQVIKSALKPLPIGTCLIFDVIGMQLNCSAIVEGLLFGWKNVFDMHRFDFANLTILSFHDSKGDIISNRTVVGNPSVLLPVQTSTVANCSKGDVHFARVACNLDFAHLVSLPTYGASILRVGFYIKLPETTVVQVNGTGDNYNLTTWHGAANLATLTLAQVCADILKPCLQDGPITLKAANFNLQDVQIDDTSVLKMIQAKILKLGFKQICASVFKQLCPGYSNQPHAAIEHIHQSEPGPDGQLVTATTIEYFQRMLNAARSFATQHTYAVSVCDKFIQGLDRRILIPFCCYYSNHSTVHDLNGAYHYLQLPIILAAATVVEEEVKQMQEIACSMLGQGFYSNIIGGGASIPAIPSQAKKTLSRYQDGGCSRECKRLPLKCFGCSEAHPWIKDKKVICPKGKDPGCIKCAAKQCKAFHARISKLCSRHSGKRF